MKTTEECLARIEEHLAAMRSIMEENHALAQKHLAQVSNPPHAAETGPPGSVDANGGGQPQHPDDDPDPEGGATDALQRGIARGNRPV